MASEWSSHRTTRAALLTYLLLNKAADIPVAQPAASTQHPTFYRSDALPDAQWTAPKHWMHNLNRLEHKTDEHATLKQLEKSITIICHYMKTTTPHHNHFTAFFRGPPGWTDARRELLDFMVQGKINRGRHTDHLAGCHSIRTNQCPCPPSPHFYRPDALPAAQPTASKHWRQYYMKTNQR